jgi:hypothetical protein
MSNYNWARGKIVIPSKDYPKVRDALIAFQNARQKRLLAKALKVWEVVKATKFKRGANRFAIVEDSWTAEQTLGSGNAINRAFGRDDDQDGNDRRKIALSIFPPQKDAEGKVLWNKHVSRAQKPKKKDFPLANKSTKSFSTMDLTISLDPKTRVVHFMGDENNRAQERALESDLAGALFDALNRVTWTRGSGGKIMGNDEYNRDDYSDGGGANYVLHEWSKDKTPRRRQSFAYGGGPSGLYGGSFTYGRRY